MGKVVVGIINDTTSCHVSSALMLLYHCLPPIRDALLHLSSQSFSIVAMEDVVTIELSSFVREYYEYSCDGDDRENKPVPKPSNLYRCLSSKLGIEAEEFGDAVTTLAKILQFLREKSHPALQALVSATLDGTTQTVLKSDQRCKTLKSRTMTCPYWVPRGDCSDLVEALMQATRPTELVGYQWSNEANHVNEPGGSNPEETMFSRTTKETVIDNAPPMWLMQIESRRDARQQGSQVLHTMTTPLELSAQSLGINANNYRLTGGILFIACVEGDATEETGHTITVIRNRENETEWHCIDDDKVSQVSTERAQQLLSGCEMDHGVARGILLVYERLEWSWKGQMKIFLDDVRSQSTTVDWTKPLDLVGRRLQIKWTGEKFYSGTVTAYDAKAGKHTVTYDDGDVRMYNLKSKAVNWL